MKTTLCVISIFLLFPAVALAQEPIKIGATLTLSGFASFWGESQRRGMELALSEVNNAGGINGRPLQIAYEDIGPVDLKRAASAAQKLISVEKVAMLLPQWAEDTAVVWPIAAKANVMTMAMSAGAKPAGRLVFNAAPSYDLAVAKAVDYIARKGMRRTCAVVDQSTFFLRMRDALVASVSAASGTAPLIEEYPGHDNNFKPTLLRFKREKCEALFLLVFSNKAQPLLRQARESAFGPTLVFVGGFGADEVRALGELGSGLINAEIKAPGEPFKGKFRARYGSDADLPAGYGYDAILVVTEALRRAKALDGESIRSGLLAIKNFPGVTGRIGFNENGDRTGGEAELYVVKNGRLETLQE